MTSSVDRCMTHNEVFTETDRKFVEADKDEGMDYVCFPGRFDSPINTTEDMLMRQIERK